MNRTDRTEKQLDPVYVLLKLENNPIHGILIDISERDLVFQSTFEGNVPIGSSQQLDVFADGQYFLKNLTVKILSDNQFVDEKSFDKLPTRTIAVRHPNGEIAENITSRIKNAGIYFQKTVSEPDFVIEKIIKWLDGMGDLKTMHLTGTEMQDLFRWMSSGSDKDKKL